MKTIVLICPNDDCLAMVEIEVQEIIPARNMRGRMEDAILEEGGDFSPCECPECGADFSREAVHEAAFN